MKTLPIRHVLPAIAGALFGLSRAALTATTHGQTIRGEPQGSVGGGAASGRSASRGWGMRAIDLLADPPTGTPFPGTPGGERARDAAGLAPW